MASTGLEDLIFTSFSAVFEAFSRRFRRTWLQFSKAESCKFIKWFVLPHGRTPRPLELYRPLGCGRLRAVWAT